MNNELRQKYEKLIYNYAQNNYTKMFREPDGNLKHKFIVPGSVYANSLWDWDSWLTDIALSNLDLDRDISEYEKGCVINFLDFIGEDGSMPIFIFPSTDFCKTRKNTNIHKPNIAQHALFISRKYNDFEWISPYFADIEMFIGYYEKNCKHESGLYFWIDDCAIGVDNDPCTFYRPKRSSASIYLNCFMYKELLAISEIAKNLLFIDKSKKYAERAEELKKSIQEHCYDERNGFYYSVDVDLLPIDENSNVHKGCPRHWNTLIRKIDVWSGFMTMWANIATEEQVERMVFENYRDEKTFNARYGVRTLSKLEKMYVVKKSGNPSCWLGPIWGISNYMTFKGLLNYGYIEDALSLADKTTELFGKDIEACGEMHEYYDPDTGVGVNNPGFQNWNLLSINMFQEVEKYR